MTKDGELKLKTDSDLKGGSIPLKANLTRPFKIQTLKNLLLI